MPCPRLRHAVGGYLQSRVMKIDYGRVSTRDQNPSAQRDALAAAGCDRVFIDHALMSERTKDGLAAALLSTHSSPPPWTPGFRCATCNQPGSGLERVEAISAGAECLVALAVGEEDQPPLEAAHDHQAGRGNSVAGRARDGHGRCP